MFHPNRNLTRFFILSIISAAQSLGFSSLSAKAESLLILTPENARSLGLDYAKAASLLNEAGSFIDKGEIGVRFHEETRKVDLTCFDSFSIRVDLEQVSVGPDNGDIGGL